FVFGTNWAWYQCLSYFALAGMAAAAFYIANTVLNLPTGPSLLACVLVVLSPPVVKPPVLWAFGFAIEPLATLFVVGVFLAAITRRDSLCLMLLFLALLTKETAVWATVGAAITIMLRPARDESLPHRALAAVTMFLPIIMWLGFRFIFFNGIGGTYATHGYTSLTDFLRLIFHKVKHIHSLFVWYDWRRWDEDFLGFGLAILVYLLLFLWAVRILPETVNRVRNAIRDTRWPTVDFFSLVTLWAAIAFAFHFALPLNNERYETSLVMFAWPALVAVTAK